MGGTRFSKIKGEKFGLSAIELHETGVLVDLRKKSVQSGKSSAKKKVDNDKPKTLEEQTDEKRIHEIEQKIGGIAETDDVEIDDAETDDAEIDDVETGEKGITADERLRKNLTDFVSENFPNDDTPEEDSSQKTAQDLSR